MVTPINAVHFHSDFGEADPWLRDESARSYQPDEETFAPARGAMFGLVLGALMWVGIIAGVRALFGL